MARYCSNADGGGKGVAVGVGVSCVSKSVWVAVGVEVGDGSGIVTMTCGVKTGMGVGARVGIGVGLDWHALSATSIMTKSELRKEKLENIGAHFSILNYAAQMLACCPKRSIIAATLHEEK